MNFCQTYFSKDLDDLTADDLIHFFNSPQKESQYLEFKSAREPNLDKVFTNNLKPGICSFLNSEGGLLIYGTPKEDKKNPENPYHGPFQPYQKGFLGEHDTIIRKVSDGIIPMPVGVRLKEIEFENGFVAVFEIQQSLTKPHQTENTYQIRIDGQKKSAPHYLIEAMMRQISYPDLRAYIKVVKSEYDVKGENLIISFFVILTNFSEFQNEKNVRFRLRLQGPMEFIPGRLHKTISSKITKFMKIESAISRIPLKQKFKIKGEFGFHSSNEEIKLEVIFHGESSPPKVSGYSFEIESKNMRGFLKDGRAKLKIDNILLSDYQKLQGYENVESMIKGLDIDI